MIKHMVMWTLKDQAEGHTKAENQAAVKAALETLPGLIPFIVKLKVVTEFVAVDPAVDVLLYTEFKSKEDLKAYAVHPEHVKVADFNSKVVSGRRVLDYED